MLKLDEAAARAHALDDCAVAVPRHCQATLDELAVEVEVCGHGQSPTRQA